MSTFFRRFHNRREKKLQAERLASKVTVSVQIETKDGRVVDAVASFFPDIMKKPCQDVDVESKEDFQEWKSMPGVPANKATFNLATGKHVTWGQGRYDLDEYPRLTPQSHLAVKIAVDYAVLANKSVK